VGQHVQREAWQAVSLAEPLALLAELLAGLLGERQGVHLVRWVFRVQEWVRPWDTQDLKVRHTLPLHLDMDMEVYIAGAEE